MSKNLSRRLLVAGAVSLPALTVPALASPDPVFAAIDRHNLALDVLVATQTREPSLHSPGYWGWQEEHEALGDASRDAYRAMLGTPPTTDDGAAALIRAFLEYEGEQTNDIECAAPLLKSLLAYLEK